MAQAAGRPTAAIFEQLVEIGFRDVQGRNQAEDEAGQQSDAEREGKHPSIDADHLQARQLVRAERGQSLDAKDAEQQSEQAAEEGDQQALGQYLPDDSPAARAE